jgi:uncharacterized membrane-anchored protein YitT (DUF2179 family)
MYQKGMQSIVSWFIACNMISFDFRKYNKMNMMVIMSDRSGMMEEEIYELLKGTSP